MIEVPQVDKNRRPTKLLWLDMEFTGLDPTKYVILEVATKVTDFNFQTLADFSIVVQHDDSVLANATRWNLEHHSANGLFDKVRASSVSGDQASRQLKEFIERHFGEEKAIIADNSIQQDVAFISRHWPSVKRRLHFRTLDVTSFKILLWGKYDIGYEKKHDHRGSGDIDESIAELQFLIKSLANIGAHIAG